MKLAAIASKLPPIESGYCSMWAGLWMRRKIRPAGPCASTLDVERPVTGVLLSHAHQDHYGLLGELPTSWPVYCGKAAESLIRLTSGIFGKNPLQPFRNWESNFPFELGAFRITPFLTDHSAFDAYMKRRICEPGRSLWLRIAVTISSMSSLSSLSCCSLRSTPDRMSCSQLRPSTVSMPDRTRPISRSRQRRPAQRSGGPSENDKKAGQGMSTQQDSFSAAHRVL